MKNLCKEYLTKFCVEINDRSVGSPGNRATTDFIEKKLKSLGWQTKKEEFAAIDWKNEGAHLSSKNSSFEVCPSPYSLPCNTKGELIAASSLQELTQINIKDKLLLLYGDIAKEQLMPKNFVFYNPKEHRKIISYLEKEEPAAIITATERNAALAGGVYPFPMIEDGDFDIPSVYMTAEEGAKLSSFIGKTLNLKSNSKRIPAKGYNVIAKKGKQSQNRVVVTAHVDAKKGSPGAIDNATGIIVMLLLAELLKKYNGDKTIELAFLNGEDYFAVPGQMLYIKNNQNNFEEIKLNINIDGAGLKDSKTAFSFYDLDEKTKLKIEHAIKSFDSITTGKKWVQGDHSIFIQKGCRAIAISSDWFINNIDKQNITHTNRDNIDIVDCANIKDIAMALHSFLTNK